VIDVWLIELERDLPRSLLTLLDAGERQRASRFKFERDSRRFVVAHGAMRLILAEMTGLPAAHLVFEHNAYGKPFIALDNAPLFSLSHSGEIALFAVLRAVDGLFESAANNSVELGVDIEQCREIQAVEMAARFFSAEECRSLLNLPVEQRHSAFFTCWTRKEAYIKAKGRGLSLPLNDFSVECRPHLPAALISSRFQPDDVEYFYFWDLSVPKGYKAALACRLPYCGQVLNPPQMRIWSF
jgi:4'-phosphopantetheinyl transferase